MGWRPGEVILRREVIPAGVWEVMPVHVVEDTTDLLVTYLPEGAEMGFPEGDWPTPDGRHPWDRKAAWQGHGVLMLHRPEEMHAVWHFWSGQERAFSCWYLNLQEPFRRTAVGFDTQDLELDVVVRPDGSWHFKDDELLAQRVAEGRFTTEQVASIRAEGARIATDLDRGAHWWDHGWAEWEPDPAWRDTCLPADWRDHLDP